jgi:hypothetical protein
MVYCCRPINGNEFEGKAADSPENETVCHLLLHRDAGWAAWRARIRIILLAARQKPAPLEKPQGRTAGPALPSRTPMSARPFAVGGSVSRRTVPSAYIAAEPGRVGQALPLLAAWWSSCARWEATSAEITVQTAPEVLWPRGSHDQFVFGIDRGFVIEGKTHGHEGTGCGYALESVEGCIV